MYPVVELAKKSNLSSPKKILYNLSQGWGPKYHILKGALIGAMDQNWLMLFAPYTFGIRERIPKCSIAISTVLSVNFTYGVHHPLRHTPKLAKESNRSLVRPVGYLMCHSKQRIMNLFGEEIQHDIVIILCGNVVTMIPQIMPKCHY